MLNRDDISAGFVKVLKDVIGSDLATLTLADGNTTPAVIQTRQAGPKPDKPYVSVNVGNFILPSGWLLHEYWDENNVRTYLVLYEMFVDFKCFGDGSQDIMRKWHSLMSMGPIIQRIRDNVFDAAVQKQGDILDTPDLLSTDFEEGATLTSSFYIIDTIQDPTGTLVSFIQDVEGIGTIVTGVNGDIILNFDIPNITLDNTFFTLDSTEITLDQTVLGI